jgi:hypothetical protein
MMVSNVNKEGNNRDNANRYNPKEISKDYWVVTALVKSKAGGL